MMIYQTYLIFFKFAPQRSDAVPSLKKDCCLSNNVRDYHFVSQVRSGCLPWPCRYNNRKLCERNGCNGSDKIMFQGKITVDSIDDKEDMGFVDEAFDILGFTKQEKVIK